MKKIYLAIVASSLLNFNLFAQTDSTSVEKNELFDLTLEEMLNVDVVDKKFKLYGFFNTNLQKTFSVSTLDENGITVYEDEPMEWSAPQNFHLYGSATLSDKITVFLNLARTSEDGIEIRNAWGNVKIKEGFQVRVGKAYRKFGLYNEKLDQLPTFIGIEAPELFDVDHLFLTRTTNLMIHGNFHNNLGEISYAVSTENGEGGASKELVPLGFDLRLKTNSMIIGTSGFTSTINSVSTTSTVALGEGSPRGGVLPWMAGDQYTVFGGFVEKQMGDLLVQAEYWTSNHDAERDALSVLEIINNGDINQTQRDRFLGANSGKDNSLLTEADVVTAVKYTAQTFYLRLGYNIDTRIGQFVPYIFADWMSHPEVIQKKTYGGDNESGFADDGVFFKPSLGLVYRPIQAVAIKLDGSTHTQKFNGRTETYPEIRLDFSYAFK